MSAFDVLNKINVNEKTEKKNGLTYLSWAWAWGEVKKAFPNATFTIYERNTEHGPVNYFTDGRTCWVKTGLTIEGLEHIEELPVMDFRNNSIPLEKVTSTDVNKAIQRSLTKAAARHGLGLYIYAGEDLPEEESAVKKEAEKEKAKEFLDKAKEKQTTNPVQATTSKKVPESPVKTYIANEMSFMKEMFGIPDTTQMAKKFAEMRKALIADGEVEDVSSDKLTMEQAADLFEKIYKRFKPSGEQA